MKRAFGEKSPGAFLLEGEIKMPYKPKHPCAYPGCPNLTDRRFCSEHEKQENARYEKYDRDPAVHRRYGRAWKRIRDSYAKAHPLCEECLKAGKAVPMDEVHHRLPLAEGGTHARDNLVSLCKSCHSRIHVERGDRWNKTKTPGGVGISTGAAPGNGAGVTREEKAKSKG